eukprot:TRINITY_DN238_c0_g6_i1.p1 TRINITY_DN238_c0_g6~~TRINITY_DN238_c0_g6_i1.p1  ORF type:complete len:921 (-),score=202.65 TRINITY_DN238_c0_g6_i1:2125-4887(-)
MSRKIEGSQKICRSPTNMHSDQPQSKRLRANFDADLGDEASTKKQNAKEWIGSFPQKTLSQQHITRMLQDIQSKSVSFDIKEKLIDVIGLSSLRFEGDSHTIVDTFYKMIETPSIQENHRVLVKLLRYTNICTQGKSLDTQKLVSQAKTFIRHSDSSVRCISLRIIGDLQHLGALDESLDLIEQLIQDYDPTVRTAAYDALLTLHARKYPLHIDLYKVSVLSLMDDHESVRSRAMRLIWILGKSYPNHAILKPIGQGTTTTQIRLIDDAFVKISDMVNDRSVSIRTLACSLLGSLGDVSLSNLLQTFSKEVLKEGRVIQTASAPESGAQGDKEVATIEDINILESGAAGAFIHGLEDEYLEVRHAAIDSICELGSQFEDFSKRALDFLVDMFNDEIDAVRVNAINSVKKLRGFVQLSEEQLDVGLGVLEDYNDEIRYSMHELLGCIHLANTNSLHASVKALHANIRKYPQDTMEIYRCFKLLGKHHGSFSELLVEELLGVDSTFLTQEPKVDDAVYTATLIMYMNASESNPNILPLLPKYAFRHYDYLREQYPDLFPALKLERLGGEYIQYTSLPHHEEGNAERSDIESNIGLVVDSLQKAFSTCIFSGSALLLHTLRANARNLSYLRKLKTKSTDWTCFLSDFTNSLIDLLEKSSAIKQQSSLTFWKIGSQFTFLRIQYLGLSRSICRALEELEIICRILGIVCELHYRLDAPALTESDRAECIKYITQDLVLGDMSRAQENQTGLAVFYNLLQKFQYAEIVSTLKAKYILPDIRVHNRVHQIEAYVELAVKENMEQLWELPFVLQLSGWIKYTEDPAAIRIRIRSLDGESQTFPLGWDNITQTSAMQMEFKSQIRFYLRPWTEKSQLLVDMVLSQNAHAHYESLPRKLRDPAHTPEIWLAVKMEEPLRIHVWPKAKNN